MEELYSIKVKLFRAGMKGFKEGGGGGGECVATLPE